MAEEEWRGHRRIILKYKKLWGEAGGVFKPPCVIDESVKATLRQVVGRGERGEERTEEAGVV